MITPFAQRFQVMEGVVAIIEAVAVRLSSIISRSLDLLGATKEDESRPDRVTQTSSSVI